MCHRKYLSEGDYMIRQRGDKYRPIVTVLKVKKGLPTVIKVSGQIYVLRHADQFGGGKNVRDRV